jgi:putative acetyltransferase
MDVLIRRATYDDVDEILKLFRETLTSVCRSDYNREQIPVWVASAENKQNWLHRIKKQYFLIAELDDMITGFGSIENGDYIDLLYVHKDYLRQGIANRLLSELENVSGRMRKSLITADVSITAKPFFEKHGYKTIKEQKNILDGVEIINFKMIKDKAAQSSIY